MRDIFDDIFKNEPLDPIEAARRNMRPNLRKRFYQTASTSAEGDVVAILLDGKPVRTPAHRTLAAPSRALAQAIAQEWSLQQEVIDPATMPLTRLANAVLDAVADQQAAVADEIAKYLASDLLFYRAEGPEGLVAAQSRHWDPIVAWAREAFDARFVLAQGVMHVMQPAAALAAVARAIPRDPWRLGALSAITSLAGSALLALALAAEQLSLEAAWDAAHVDEDWQMAQWGRDELALERRAYRFAEVQAAATVLRLLR